MGASEIRAASPIAHPVPGVDVHLQHLHHPLVPPGAVDELVQRELPWRHTPWLLFVFLCLSGAVAWTLTVSVLIDQLEYPVDHLVGGQQVALLVQLPVAGLLQPVDGLRERQGKHVWINS